MERTYCTTGVQNIMAPLMTGSNPQMPPHKAFNTLRNLDHRHLAKDRPNGCPIFLSNESLHPFPISVP